jgi:DNA polymerase-3 subunit epsilon
MTSRIAVIDFETTGSAPGQGARATEVAIVLVEGGQVVDQFQSLMNAGVRIPPFITQLTGITNAMVEQAPPALEVMAQAHRFVCGTPLVAHNAPFDRGFWQAELARAGCDAAHPFACTVRLSRRLYPEAPNHQLGTLARFHQLPSAGRAHRALADAQVTAALLLRMQQSLTERWGVADTGHGFLLALQACAKAKLPEFLRKHAAQAPGMHAAGLQKTAICR